jgi:hypothetical protein
MLLPRETVSKISFEIIGKLLLNKVDISRPSQANHNGVSMVRDIFGNLLDGS